MLYRTALAPLAGLCTVCGIVAAQGNPSLDRYISDKIKGELSKMDSPDRGYRDGPHWVCFDNPRQHLAVEVHTRLAGDKAFLTGSASGKLAFNYQVTIETKVLGRRIVIARHDFGGYADARLALDASATLGKQLSGSKVTVKEIKVSNLRMRSDAAKPFQGVIEHWVNAKLQEKKSELAGKLEAALNTVKP